MHERMIRAGMALGLTHGQAEVVAYWARGYTARSIAPRIHRSYTTVRDRLMKARKRLDARSIRECVYLVLVSMIDGEDQG
jgi:DNA-binding CsgD family transcriptional regulator